MSYKNTWRRKEFWRMQLIPQTFGCCQLRR